LLKGCDSLLRVASRSHSDGSGSGIGIPDPLSALVTAAREGRQRVVPLGLQPRNYRGEARLPFAVHASTVFQRLFECRVVALHSGHALLQRLHLARRPGASSGRCGGDARAWRAGSAC
jgi:hypothetical protein